MIALSDINAIFFNFFLSIFVAVVSTKNATPGRSCTSSVMMRSNLSVKLLNEEDIRSDYRKVNFPLRGELYEKTVKLDEELSRGALKNFTRLIIANTVDAQAMGQKPMTFIRQMLAAVAHPPLITSSVFPSDVNQRAQDLLNEMKGHSMGSLSDFKGLPLVRKQIAEFIYLRDDVRPNFENIYLTNGCSAGIELALTLVEAECKDVKVGVMTSVPVYPLYPALLSKHGLVKIDYPLSPNNSWALEVSSLDKIFEKALCSCKPKVLIIVNPGNPSGKILRPEQLQAIVKFAYKRNLILFVDEIFQHNLLTDVPFTSIYKIISELEQPYNHTEAFAFHGVSKGYAAESGLRGGFMQLINFDEKVHAVLRKLLTVQECPSLPGQIATYALTNPPKPWEPSYSLFFQEKTAIVSTPGRIAKSLVARLNEITGIFCTEIEAGAVLFPQITMPERAVKEAKKQGNSPDVFYATQLLEATGISLAVGSAFGNFPANQYFLRISIPTNEQDADILVKSLKTFNEQFLKTYS